MSTTTVCGPAAAASFASFGAGAGEVSLRVIDAFIPFLALHSKNKAHSGPMLEEG